MQLKAASQLFYRYFVPTMILQLWIMFVSLPILTMWGLPLSLLSPLGNLFFTPLLVLFLFLSFVVTLTELLSLPNATIIYLLEKLTFLWGQVQLPWKHYIFIAFPTKALFIFALAIFIAAYLVHRYYRAKRLFCFFALVTLFCLTLTGGCLVPANKNYSLRFARKRKSLYVTYTKEGLLIVDRGTFRQKGNILWLRYTVVPQLLKTFGCLTINKLITATPNDKTNNCIHELKKIFTMHTIVSGEQQSV